LSDAERALPVRRARVVRTERLQGVVAEVDATERPEALAVLQAGLHPLPEGARLVHGYDVAVSGLGAWVGDRRLLVRIWPALLGADGEITEDDPDRPGADVLVVAFDPIAHAAELDALAELGRLLVAGPEGGPVPLVVDLDRDLVAERLAELRS
jgi:hypothetical protein